MQRKSWGGIFGPNTRMQDLQKKNEEVYNELSKVVHMKVPVRLLSGAES